MEIAMIYIIVNLLIGISLLVAVGLLMAAFAANKKRKKTAKNLLCSGVLALIFGSGLVLWIVSHHSFPMINDWQFIGKNIYDIEEKYDGLHLYVSDSGSGKATMSTEMITGYKFVPSEFDAYYMYFDENGTIYKTQCGRPVGG
jgi:hypothetical protein